MPMWPARAAHAAGTWFTAANGRFAAAFRVGRREDGKFLLQLRRTTARTLRALPVAGADQDFAVALAFFAMKFVNRHARRIAESQKTSSEEAGELPYSSAALAARINAFSFP